MKKTKYLLLLIGILIMQLSIAQPVQEFNKVIRLLNVPKLNTDTNLNTPIKTLLIDKYGNVIYTPYSSRTLSIDVNGYYSNTEGHIEIPFKTINNIPIIGTGDITINVSTNPLILNNINKTVTNYGLGGIISNTSFGLLALSSNTTGFANTVFGNNSLVNNIVGSGNTALGNNSLQYAENNYNTAIGSYSLQLTTGARNTALGSAALYANTTGNKNVAIGYSAGISTLSGLNTITNNSIYIGDNTFANASGQTNQIVIGEGAIGNGSNSVTLGNTSVGLTRLRGTVLGGSFIKDGGTSNEVLMANGSTRTVAKMYIAILSQSGTAAPTTTILENSLGGGTITWTRTGIGTYEGTWSGGTLNRTNCIIQKTDENATSGMSLALTAGVIIIITNNGPPSDNVLNNYGIILRIY